MGESGLRSARRYNACMATECTAPVNGPPAWQDWNGERYYRNPETGYYQQFHGGYLHRHVWSSVHGEIPDDHHVHHRDDDQVHNDISNLHLIEGREHIRLHAGAWAHNGDPERDAEVTRVASERASAAWATREPRDVACEGPDCDVVFQSTGMRARFHAPRCRAAFYRAQSRAKHDL